MQNAIRKHARVQHGGVISVQDPNLTEGADAEVIILVPRTSNDLGQSEDLPSLRSMIGAAKGIFGSAEEIDQYMRDLRNEWD